jgi:hypothetical protein
VTLTTAGKPHTPLADINLPFVPVSKIHDGDGDEPERQHIRVQRSGGREGALAGWALALGDLERGLNTRFHVRAILLF